MTMINSIDKLAEELKDADHPIEIIDIDFDDIKRWMNGDNDAIDIPVSNSEILNAIGEASDMFPAYVILRIS